MARDRRAALPRANPLPGHRCAARQDLAPRSALVEFDVSKDWFVIRSAQIERPRARCECAGLNEDRIQLLGSPVRSTNLARDVDQARVSGRGSEPAPKLKARWPERVQVSRH